MSGCGGATRRKSRRIAPPVRASSSRTPAAATTSSSQLFGIFGGIARLGEFTTATALGRALGDAIAASTANVLRASYRDIDLDDPGAHEAKANAERILRTSVLLGLGATLVGCLGAPAYPAARKLYESVGFREFTRDVPYLKRA